MEDQNNFSIIGISPRNAYYTKTNIAFAIDTLLRTQKNVLVFIPEIPDIHNYLAYGYEKEAARKKAASIGKSFRKTVREICAERGYSCDEKGLSKPHIHLIDWEAEVENSFHYQESLEEIARLYRTNDSFRQAVQAASLSSLHSRIKQDDRLQKRIKAQGIEKIINQAVPYIINEIAFLNAAPEIYGGKHSDYVYHREWPVFQNFISGQYDNSRPKLGFRIISNSSTP